MFPATAFVPEPARLRRVPVLPKRSQNDALPPTPSRGQAFVPLSLGPFPLHGPPPAGPVQSLAMRVAEIFHSVQGEGKLTGTPSGFVRVSGCNLRCTWCDTPYTSWEPEGPDMTPAEIAEQLARFPVRHVVVTGGEPMIMAGITELTRLLREQGLHITIETAATVWRDVECDLASLSPKLSNSTPYDRDRGRFADPHEKNRVRLDVIQRFVDTFDHQLKFVVDRPGDMDEIDEILGGLRGVVPGNVLLMPQGIDQASLDEKGRWVAELCKSRGFRFCPRLHIMLYGNVRGT